MGRLRRAGGCAFTVAFTYCWAALADDALAMAVVVLDVDEQHRCDARLQAALPLGGVGRIGRRHSTNRLAVAVTGGRVAAAGGGRVTVAVAVVTAAVDGCRPMWR